MDVEWELSRKQMENINDTTEYLIFEGSARSGKTITACHKTIMYGLSYAGARIGVFRQTLPSLKDTAWLEIRQLLDKYKIPYDENKSEGHIFFPNNSIIFFKPLDDLRKIRSMTLDFIYVEQAEEIHLSSFQELESRVSGEVAAKNYPQKLLVVQPELRNNWVYRRFHMHRNEPEIRIVHFHYTDNPFLSDQYIKFAEDRKKYDYDNYIRLTLGLWQDAGGLIYSNYDFAKSNKGFEYFTGGLDFGWSNPSCFLLVGWLDGEPYVIGEVYQSHLTNQELIDKCNALLYFNGLNPSKLDTVFADAAEPDRIEEFCQHGYNCVPGIKNVEAKINSVRSVRVHIDEKACPNTKEEIESYAYLKDKEGNDTEKPDKKHDHAMDALGYLVYGTVGVLSPYVNQYNPEYVEVTCFGRKA